MKTKESLFQRYTSLLVVLGLLFFVSSCATQDAQVALDLNANPTYTSTMTITTCMNNDKNPLDCSQEDIMLTDVPFKATLNAGGIEDVTTANNGQVIFDYPRVTSWELLLEEYEARTGRCAETWARNEDGTAINIIFDICGAVEI